MRLNDSAIKLGILLQCIGVLFICLWWITGFVGCQSRDAEAKPGVAVVTINQLTLTTDDLRAELRVNKLSPHRVETTDEQEPSWLSHLIERELLVQEAQGLGLDREREFMGTIERFWKEALIKQLLNRVGKEISAKIRVYEPEIEAYYKERAAEEGYDSVAPLSDLRDEISRKIRQEREMQAMEDWLLDLRKQAIITIDEQALAKL
jgi:hypothetical protein